MIKRGEGGRANKEREKERERERGRTSSQSHFTAKGHTVARSIFSRDHMSPAAACTERDGRSRY